MFTAEEVSQFDRDGFVIARGLTRPETLATMRAVTEYGLSQTVLPVEFEADLRYPGAPVSRDAQGGRTIRRLKQAFTRDYIFTDWMLDPNVLGRLQQLLGPTIVCPLAHHNCIMTKQPQFSSDTGWHQDIRYWAFTRPQLVNAWIALGTERARNGGLKVIPGSHRMHFAPEQFDEQTFFRADWPPNQPIIDTQVSVDLDPGDVLFFHCLTLHAATRNHTTEPKWSVVFTFRPGDNPPLRGSRSAMLPELLLTPGA